MERPKNKIRCLYEEVYEDTLTKAKNLGLKAGQSHLIDQDGLFLKPKKRELEREVIKR